MIMKNKKLIFIIAAITVLVFFFIIDTIKGIQTNLEKRKNLTDSEKFIEDFGSFENYSFEELISKENFGSFTESATLTCEIWFGYRRSAPALAARMIWPSRARSWVVPSASTSRPITL